VLTSGQKGGGSRGGGNGRHPLDYDRRAIPLVKPYLRSEDPLRQRAASTALGLLGATGVVPDLLALLLSRDAHVVGCALTALDRLGEKRMVAAYRGVPDGVGDAMLDAPHMVNEGERRIILPLLRGLTRPTIAVAQSAPG
jgi:hypothetical protein